MPSDHIRASDRDRDAVVSTLRDAYSEGRLNLDEFQERTSAAYGARTWGALRELTTDLPVQPALGGDLPTEAQPEAPLPVSGTVPVNGAQPPAPGQRPFPGPSPYPGAPPYPGPYPYPLAQPPHQRQPVSGETPPPPQHRGRPFGPVVPVVAMWVLFALATRSAGGAVAFLIAVALLVTLASVGRRPPRGPSGKR